MASRSSQLFITSAVAGLLAMGTIGTMAAPAHAEEDGVKCYGINKCKGTGECGGKGHSCAGENGCKGQGWLKLDKDTCLKIQGGRLTPEEGKS